MGLKILVYDRDGYLIALVNSGDWPGTRMVSAIVEAVERLDNRECANMTWSP